MIVETRLTTERPRRLRIGMDDANWSIIPFTHDADGRDVMMFALRPGHGRGAGMSDTDVAIVGIGIHPFGRNDRTGLEQGASPARRAADAGISWSDIQFAFGGSAPRARPTRWSASSA